MTTVFQISRMLLAFTFVMWLLTLNEDDRRKVELRVRDFLPDSITIS